MQDFSSISVSSYDAASLADRLTEKSAEGWDVVAIVPAGTNVTAYLSRATDSGDASTGGDQMSDARVSDGASEDGASDESIPPVSELSSAGTPEAAAAASALAPSEPAGWASAPDLEYAGASTATEASAPAEVPDEHIPASEQWAAQTEQPPTQPEPEPEPVQQEAAAAPAGWYADPANRYELRYWDGTQWTEHVSRSGQQYTDPPVA